MNKRDFIIDIIALVVYLVVANPSITGFALHEWISLGIFVVLFVHICVHMDWVIDVLKGAFKKPTFMRVGNLVIDILIFLTFMVCVLSGVFESATVLPALGVYTAIGYATWHILHAFTAKLLLALIIVHVAIHWRWFVVFFKSKGKASAANALYNESLMGSDENEELSSEDQTE